MNLHDLERLQSKLKHDMAAFGPAWKMKHHRMVGATPPFPDEAFSSWCERISLQFRAKKSVILERLGIDAPVIAVDAGQVSLDIDHIAYLTGIERSRLADFDAAACTLMKSPEYAYLTSNVLYNAPVFRYCECCLCEDDQPYGRRLWRLSFVHLCPKHKTVLRDRCPNCNHRISSGYGRSQRTASLRFCHSCNYNLGAASSVFLPERQTLIMLQRQAVWVRLLSSLGSFKPDLSYWYGDDDPEWVYEAYGQQRGLLDGRFHDRLYRCTGHLRFKRGERFALRRACVEMMFEAKSYSVHVAKLNRYASLGSEYAELRDATLIAKTLAECHNLSHGEDLWCALKGMDSIDALIHAPAHVWEDFQVWRKPGEFSPTYRHGLPAPIGSLVSQRITA